MKTDSYVYGVETLNGHDAWALFEACALGDLPRATTLLTQDPRLANAQVDYQFPMHMAVRAGHAEVVRLLLARGADPGQSRFTYSSWDKLLAYARDRGYDQVASVLERAMRRRFHYAPGFDRLKEAIVARSPRRVSAVLRSQPELAAASDALGNNALHWSVLTRQLDMIQRFVDLGTPIDARRADGHTPLLLAASGGTDYWYRDTRGRSHPSLRNVYVLVGYLLARGANYSVSVAAAAGDQERVEQLLRKDAGLARQLDSARVSPLAHAAYQGHLHIVRLLLEHGADPNMPEECAPEGAALYYACQRNHREIAELLLAHGANPNAGFDSGGCCLTVCVHYHGDRAKPVQELLLRHGAYSPPYDMDVKQMKQAIRKGHHVIRDWEFLVHLVLKNDAKLLDLYLGADPAGLERLRSGALTAYPKSPAMIRKLLAAGLDPNGRNWLGRTILHACAENGDRSAAAVFLAAGADIDARDSEFQGTPLAATVRYEPWCRTADRQEHAERQRRMVEFLLRRGAATNLPGDQPWATPLAWARKRGLADIAEMLRKHGAS
jgi:ankyrin repeat protein